MRVSGLKIPAVPLTFFKNCVAVVCLVLLLMILGEDWMYDIDANMDLYYLDLLSYRDVSNEVGYKFQVIHQSPQLLVIRNGITAAHASHGAINDLNLSAFI